MSAQNPVTEKNTKSEIFRAYEELLQKVKESCMPSNKINKELQEKHEVIKTASTLSTENIVSSLSTLKLDIMKSLDHIGDQLIQQQKTFTVLQNAIDIETKNLEELYDIKAEANSLAALLLANKEKKTIFEMDLDKEKNDFEIEINEKRLTFKRQQDLFEQQAKEAKEKLIKERERENEEYQYKINHERKRDEDFYIAKKQALENELNQKSNFFEKSCKEREASLKLRENELEELQTRVSTFPLTLENAIKNCEKQLSEKLSTQFKFESNLKSKESEGEIKLLKQTIMALEIKVNEKDVLIEQLTQKSNQATLQIQDIAVRAIEGASASRAFQNIFERKFDSDKPNKVQ